MPTAKISVDRFQDIPRFKLVNASTPIETCKSLEAILPSSPTLFIKRDDFTNYLVGGNKLRKLEYTMAAVLKQKATAVVTIGSFQSNHARITAMVARRLGLKCFLVLNGEPSDPPTGNHLILKTMGIEVIRVNSRDDRLPMMDQLVRDLKLRGENTFGIPLGASDEIGAFGMTAALSEVVGQEKEIGRKFDVIFVGSSSGGTQAGLEVGKRFLGREDLRIIGISPDDPAPSIKSSIVNIAEKMLKKLDIHSGLMPEDIEVDDSYIGQGYGKPTPASIEAMQLFAENEGILLDPVYTSKVGAAMIDYAKKGLLKSSENVLFWHTGGLMGIFG